MPVAKFLTAVVGLFVVAAMLVRPHRPAPKLWAAYVSMRADLRNLVDAQENFRADSARYASSLQELSEARFQMSANVSVALTSANDSAWSASATNEFAPEHTCRISVSLALGQPETVEAIPACEPELRTRGWRWAWQ